MRAAAIWAVNRRDPVTIPSSVRRTSRSRSFTRSAARSSASESPQSVRTLCRARLNFGTTCVDTRAASFRISRDQDPLIPPASTSPLSGRTGWTPDTIAGVPAVRSWTRGVHIAFASLQAFSLVTGKSDPPPGIRTSDADGCPTGLFWTLPGR